MRHPERDTVTAELVSGPGDGMVLEWDANAAQREVYYIQVGGNMSTYGLLDLYVDRDGAYLVYGYIE